MHIHAPHHPPCTFRPDLTLSRRGINCLQLEKIWDTAQSDMDAKRWAAVMLAPVLMMMGAAQRVQVGGLLAACITTALSVTKPYVEQAMCRTCIEFLLSWSRCAAVQFVMGRSPDALIPLSLALCASNTPPLVAHVSAQQTPTTCKTQFIVPAQP